MRIERLILVSLIILGFGIVLVKAEDKEPWTFVSSCETDSTDPIFRSGTIFAYIYETSRTPVVALLYRITRGKAPGISQTDSTAAFSVVIVDNKWFTVEGIASLAQRSTQTEGPLFEAQGGIESALIARDVITFLRDQPFSLVADWKLMVLGEHQIETCAIDYLQTEHYLR